MNKDCCKKIVETEGPLAQYEDMTEWLQEWTDVPTKSSKTVEIDLFQLLLDASDDDRTRLQEFFEQKEEE